jgi:nucleotide-binding universal stress UspA family protein
MMEMLMDKILLPAEFPTTSLTVVRQAAFLARHFHSEIVLLHVVASMSYPVGMIELGYELTGGLHAEVLKRAQQDLDQSLKQELDGIAVKRLLLSGDPAREIVQAPRDEKVNLIMMSTHSRGVFLPLSAGLGGGESATRQRLFGLGEAYTEEAPAREFGIRSVLRAVDLSHHSRNTVARAAQIAAEV